MALNTGLYLDNCIEVVVAIPAYNESATLPIIVKELSLSLSEKDAILILDDSTFQIHTETQSAVTSAVNNPKCLVFFSHHNGKSGRGAAVRRGMALSIEKFPKLKYFIECDADGSHQVVDIAKLKSSDIVCDLLVGSRYIKESRIIGWPISRRVFSKILNSIIPFMLNVPLKDITNGLRRYTPQALRQILLHEPINTGFTYLSEQAFVIHVNQLKINEIPIIFVERIAGHSTVTWKEIFNSLRGITFLLLLKKKIKKNA
jgi:dolichol-phosphate mannosyltransferase